MEPDRKDRVPQLEKAPVGQKAVKVVGAPASKKAGEAVSAELRMLTTAPGAATGVMKSHR